MANKTLFSSSKRTPRADSRNHEGAPAYDYSPEALLAQLAATGTLGDAFYSTAEQQLKEALTALDMVDPHYAAQVAVYARQRGAMKDMPALITAWLTVADPDLAVRVFGRVIDNGRMLRNFVQVLRSGQIGRKSLGSRPKRLVREWLERASMRELMAAATGAAPSLADVVKMVHPKPADEQRRAFYGWLIGKPYAVESLPPEIAAFEAWKENRTRPLPPVPFEWLTAFPLTKKQWGILAGQMGWQALRINLNTLARHDAFRVKGVTEQVAERLADPTALARARVLPYQLMMALNAVDKAVPGKVRDALEQALQASLANVPKVEGHVIVCPDVSGSMQSPVTGHRKGATSAVRCIDVAALISAAMLRTNRQARVLPFEQRVVSVNLDPGDRVAVNAARLAKICGGGTNVSAPLVKLVQEQAKVDLVVIVSDNESWVDANNRGRHGETATVQAWNQIVAHRPARLVCINIQPYGTTQASGRADILNVGGFSDAVFDTIARFASGETQDWVAMVKQVAV